MNVELLRWLEVRARGLPASGDVISSGLQRYLEFQAGLVLRQGLPTCVTGWDVNGCKFL